MRYRAVVLCVGFGVVALVGTLAESKVADEVSALLASARSLLPEYECDISLQIVSTPLIRETKLKLELLEHVFARATYAQSAQAIRDVGVSTETRSSRLSTAHGTRSSVLGLQTRAIEAMLQISPARAWTLFTEISVPHRGPASCAEATVPDYNDYYRVLGRLLENTPKESPEVLKKRLIFVNQQLWSMTSLSELISAAGILSNPRLGVADREAIAGIIADRLAHLGPSYRELAYWDRHGAGKSIRAIAEALTHAGVDPSTLVREYGSFLRRSLVSRQCDDRGNRLVGGFDPAEAVKYFNTTMRELAPRVDPIPAGNALAQSDEQTAVFEQLPEPKQFYGLLRAVRSSDPVASAGAKSDIENFLTRLASFERDCLNCSPEAVFHQKCMLYHVLFDAVSEPGAQERVLESYLNYLGGSPMQLNSPVEWITQVRLLLYLGGRLSPEDRDAASKVRQSGRTLSMLPKPGGTSVVQRMKESRNLTLNAYGRLEELVPSSYGPPPHLR